MCALMQCRVLKSLLTDKVMPHKRTPGAKTSQGLVDLKLPWSPDNKELEDILAHGHHGGGQDRATFQCIQGIERKFSWEITNGWFQRQDISVMRRRRIKK